MSYKKKTLLLIGIATLVRCIIACSIELGNDEVYYRMYAQDLQWNYFDHPPIVGWLIRLSTVNLLLDNEFFIRLGAIVSAAITTWMFFLSGKKIGNEQTGFLAAIIYTATLYGSIIAGTFILPDSPQMVCWTVGLYLLIDISANTGSNKKNNITVLLFGLVAGVGMLCKIHTSFLWLGFLLYLVFYNRERLKQPALYLSGIITLLLFYPVVRWNIDNHFATYMFHSKRINVASGGFNISSFLTFAGGQVFYCNAVIFPFILLATIAAFKNKLPVLPAHKRILLFCSLPLIGVATAISFFKDVLPHWTGPAYSGLILLTACYFAEHKSTAILKEKILQKPLLMATVLLAIIIATGVSVIHFFPGTLGKKDVVILGDGDFTLDMYGWKNVKTAFEKITQKEEQSGIMKKGAVIISNKWFPAAHIDFYVAMPLKKDLVAIGDTFNIHQYAWLNNKRKKLQPGDDAWCIVPSENYFDVKKMYAPLFKTVLGPGIVQQKRNGKICRVLYIYELKNYLAK